LSRYWDFISSFPNLRWETVTPPDFLESYWKYPWAADGALGFCLELFSQGKRLPGDIVFDPHREIMGAGSVQMIVHGLDHGGSELLGTQAVAASHDGDIPVVQGDLDVQIQGLADGAGFLGAVQDRDLFHAGRYGAEQRLHRERTVEPHLDGPHFLPALEEIIDGFLDGLGRRPHADDDLFRIRSPDVIEQVVPAPDLGRQLVHVLLHDGGGGLVILIDGLPALEVDIGVLGPHLDLGFFGIHGPGSEIFHVFHFQQLAHGLIGDDLHLLHLVGCAESVEKMHERDL
jgi:hypothetical protein